MILLNFFCLVKNSSLKILCVIGFDWQMEIFFFFREGNGNLEYTCHTMHLSVRIFFFHKKKFDQKNIYLCNVNKIVIPRVIN